MPRDDMAKKRKARKPKPAEPEPVDKPRTEAEKKQLRVDLLRQLCGAMPKKLFRELAGDLQTKQVHAQADRYDLAMRGKTIDLSAFLRSVFRLLVRINRHYDKWMRAGQPNGEGAETPQERNQRLRGDKLEIEVEKMRGTHIPRAEVHQGLAEFSRVMRDAGDRLQRQCGAAAYEIYDEALTNARAAVERALEKGNGKVNDG